MNPIVATGTAIEVWGFVVTEISSKIRTTQNGKRKHTNIRPMRLTRAANLHATGLQLQGKLSSQGFRMAEVPLDVRKN